MRSFYVVKCDFERLAVTDYLTTEDMKRLAADRGFIVWIHKGLSLLIPAFRVRNMAEFMRHEASLINPKGGYAFVPTDTIRLTPEFAEAITGCP